MSHEPTTSQRASRKDEHLDLAIRLHGQDRTGAFDDVSFIHHGLPGISAEQVDIGTTVLGSRWEVPFYINAMTGGTRATTAINSDLAEAAADAGVAIACGSQHVALHDPERVDGFSVIRRRAPGACAVGASGHFLRTLVKEGPEALRQELCTWSEHVRTLMTLLGSPDVSQLRRTDVLVTGRTAEQARALGVDLGGLTHRREH